MPYRAFSLYNGSVNLALFLSALLGWFTGWLVNYLADVLPDSLILSRPVCRNAKCRAPFRWRDYLLLRGCRTCKKARDGRTYLVQILAMAGAVYLWLNPPKGLGFWLGILVLAYLALVALIDIEQRLILRSLSIAGLVIGLIAGLLLNGWQMTLIGGAAGFGIMFVFYLLGVLFTRIRARRLGLSAPDNEEALGSGDVTVATILGLLLGWPLIWFCLLMGILLSGIVSLLIILALVFTGQYKKKALSVFIPYGSFFLLSAIVLVFFPGWIAALF